MRNGEKYSKGYACGWRIGVEKNASIERSSKCYERQLAAQAAEIERLRKELSRIYVHSGDGTNGECEYCNWSSDTAFNALKEVK
jgi:hypothetical protein